MKLVGCGLWVIVIIFLSFLLLTTTYPLQPTYAAESSPSADIRVKLEELKKQIASKAAKLKEEVNNKLKDKAYIGKVKQKSVSSLTLATKTGPKIVTLNQDTVFESSIKSKIKFSQKSISEEDYLIALGDIDETEVLTAKKVILLPSTTYNLKPKTYLWGQVLSTSEKLITLKGKDLKNQAVTIPSNVKVVVNDFVILTGKLGKNEIFEAEFAYIIQQGGFLRPKKIVYPAPYGAGATPSAKLSTPSAKTATPSSKKR